MPVQINADRDINGLLHDISLTAYMIVNRIQENNRINGLQRPLLPLFRYGKVWKVLSVIRLTVVSETSTP